MSTLISHNTWESVSTPTNTKIVACYWVSTIKYQANETIECYEASSVIRGLTRTYGENYCKTFSQIAQVNSISVLFLLVVSQDWPMYQLKVYWNTIL